MLNWLHQIHKSLISRLLDTFEFIKSDCVSKLLASTVWYIDKNTISSDQELAWIRSNLIKNVFIIIQQDEKSRIEKLGGSVIHWGTWRVNGQLAVSRAIGKLLNNFGFNRYSLIICGLDCFRRAIQLTIPQVFSALLRIIHLNLSVRWEPQIFANRLCCLGNEYWLQFDSFHDERLCSRVFLGELKLWENLSSRM